MIIVDSHVHSNLHIYEPVEIVLAQMDLNSVTVSYTHLTLPTKA